MRCATAFFITRADFTTCGRNILPAPKRSPTTFIPAISGPSMTSSGRAYFSRASSVSAFTKASIPRTSACDSRSSTVPLRQASSTFASTAPPRFLPFSDSPSVTSRSVASGRAVQQHIFHVLQQHLVHLLVNLQHPRIHDAHVQPRANRVIQKRRVHRLAHHVVPAIAKADIADPPAHLRIRQILLNPFASRG